MKLEHFNINDVALQILEIEDINTGKEWKSITIDDYKSIANTALQEYEEIMRDRVSYEDYENSFSKILAYADAYQKQGFLKGFSAGIRLARMIERL